MKGLYEKGLDYKSFIFNLSKADREKFIKNQISVSIKEDYRNQIGCIRTPIKILSVADVEEPNTHFNLPLLEKLVCTNNNIGLKVILKESLGSELEEPEFQNKIQMPAFIFMDGKYNILGILHGENIIEIKMLESVYKSGKQILEYNKLDCTDKIIEGVFQIIRNNN